MAETAGLTLPKFDAEGRPIQVVEPRVGSELIMATHNFCDPTTWYSTSARAQAVALTDSGDGLTWSSPHQNWIDMTHGKTFDEDAVAAESPHLFAVEVFDGDTQLEQREAFETEGGDYDVDYVTGTVTFFVSKAGKTITANYSYAVDSVWVLNPLPGKVIDIESAEAQFSADITMTDSINFDIYAYNPYDLPNKALYARSSYKRIVNFIDEAMGSFPVIPAVGGTQGRGITSPIYGFPFRYGTVRSIDASQGVELRVSLGKHRKFLGSHATATFYCTVRDV